MNYYFTKFCEIPTENNLDKRNSYSKKKYFDFFLIG